MPMRRSARPHALALATLAALVALPATAGAAVTGRHGIEIEGPRDRRGFYIGPGLTIGGQFFTDVARTDLIIIPATRLELAFGGGVTKRFTLGAVVNLGMYITGDDRIPRRATYGADVEATGFITKGFFLRGTLGGAGVPKADGTTDIAFGVGGSGGLGYEFWLNQTAALALSLTYDLRYVTGMGLRQGGFVGLRFTWY